MNIKQYYPTSVDEAIIIHERKELDWEYPDSADEAFIMSGC